MENRPDETQFLQSVYNPVLAVDSVGKIIYCNPASEKILDRSADKIIGTQIDEILQASQLTRVAKSGKTETTQTIVIRGRTYLTNRSPILSEGKVIGAVAVLQDISELDAISSELESTKLIAEELDAIFQSSYDGIYVTDGSGKTVRVNQAYERITGIKKEEVLGKKMRDLVKQGFFDESVTLKALESGNIESLVQTVKTGKTLMVTGTPIHNKEGKIKLVVTNVRDVTELSRLQEKLEVMNKFYSEKEIELKQLKDKINKESKYIFVSKKMVELKQMAIRLAQVDSTILIQGESGVGKEVFADLIHENSPRNSHPFIKLSCAAIPENLLESELFGYMPGSFTGAHRKGKIGIFEAANNGTVFLDEIGELSLGLQTKFLRVLQERKMFKIGDTSPIQVNVRIIAATNRNLQEMVTSNLFRQDLFFRLNVVPVTIPPLRERKEAIIQFIYYFLEKCNKKFGFNKQIAQNVCDLLIDYDWPGNVRELENIIERIVVTTANDIISTDNLPSIIKNPQNSFNLPSLEDHSLKAIVEDIESRVITEMLIKHQTTRKVAQILRINQSTVVRKAQKYNIPLNSIKK